MEYSAVYCGFTQPWFASIHRTRSLQRVFFIFEKENEFRRLKVRLPIYVEWNKCFFTHRLCSGDHGVRFKQKGVLFRSIDRSDTFLYFGLDALAWRPSRNFLEYLGKIFAVREAQLIGQIRQLHIGIAAEHLFGPLDAQLVHQLIKKVVRT